MKNALIILGVILLTPLAFFILYITGAFGVRGASDTTAVAVEDISPKVEVGDNPADITEIPRIPFCKPENIRAIITIGGTASNIYGSATLQNTSNEICSVIGNKYISVQYDTQINNIKNSNTGKPKTDLFQLTPNQLLYSSIEYPNSPNCQDTNETNVSFSYQISDVDTVIFTDEEGHNAFKIRVCKDLSKDATIVIAPFTDKPALR